MLTGPLPETVRYHDLVNKNAELNGTFPLSRLGRLTPLLQKLDGEVHVLLKFRRGSKQRPLVTGRAKVEVQMTCQVCLEPVALVLESDITTLLVSSQTDLDLLHQDQDGLVVNGEDLTLSDLIEDDLLLSLPMSPKHEGEDCVALEPPVSEPVVDANKGTYRPFAALKNLQLKGADDGCSAK